MLVPIGISAFNPLPNTAQQPAKFERFTALIDTGALRTCVTQNVIEKVGLQRRGRIEVRNVNGAAQHWTYLFQVAIWPDTAADMPSTLFGLGDEVEGADLFKIPYFDVLLGMDILQRGSLKLEQNGSFELAFPG